MDFTGLFEGIGQQYGLPAGLMSRTAWIESRYRPVTNPKSGAAGYFQFMPMTAQRFGLENPNDPVASAHAAAKYFAVIRDYMQSRLGRPVTPAEMYLGFQQGEGGAVKLLSNPGGVAGQTVGNRAVAWNAGDPNTSNNVFANQWLTQYENTIPGQNSAGLGAGARGAVDLSGGGSIRQGQNKNADIAAVMAAGLQDNDTDQNAILQALAAPRGFSAPGPPSGATTAAKALQAPNLDSPQVRLPTSLGEIIRGRLLASKTNVIDRTGRVKLRG